MKLLFCLALLCLAFHYTSYAQKVLTYEPILQTDSLVDETNTHTLVDPAELESTRSYLSEPVKKRGFSKERWKAITGDVDFQEEMVKDKEERVFSPWSGNLLRVISFLVIAALLITLIYYLTRYISLDYQIERTKLDTEDLAKPVENIEALDIEQLLGKAKRDGNYKLAVRLYYLGLLKKLNDEGSIVWKKDKTNRDYLAELFSSGTLFEEVRKLTRSYESVWYGDHDPGPDTFTAVAGQFERLYDKLNTKENK